MAKPIYCSECGTKLNVTLKALKGYGRIIGVVDPHICPDEPVELDLTPQENPSEYGGERQFVQNLNDLTSRGAVSTADLRDRREPAFVKSSAPLSILDQVKRAVNTHPEGDIGNEPEGE